MCRVSPPSVLDRWDHLAQHEDTAHDLVLGRLPDDGTHHGVSREQLQVYLDEFVFRHNRRNLPMAAFQTLLGLGTARKPTHYEQIRGATDIPGFDNDTLGSAETTG